jgi:hypothetical protein
MCSAVDQQMPLHILAATGHVDAVQVLIKEGQADTNTVTSAGNTALHLAAAEGHGQVVAALLRGGAHPMTASAGAEWTPLHVAALHEQLGTIELLLAAGAEVNALCELGQTPLHLACGMGGRVAAERLLGAGGDVALRDARGMTPADCAARAGHATLATDLRAWGASNPVIPGANSAGKQGGSSEGRRSVSPTLGRVSPGLSGLSSAQQQQASEKQGGWTPTAREAGLETSLGAAEALLHEAAERGGGAVHAFKAVAHLLEEHRVLDELRSVPVVNLRRIFRVMLRAGEEASD